MRADFEVETTDRLTAVDVTDRVAECLPSEAEGICTVFSRHTTAGVCINEAESRLLDDLASFLSEAVDDRGWRHDEIDDNADSHLRAALVGHDVTVPVSAGAPDLGTWQSILLVECDGPRRRTVVVADG